MRDCTQHWASLAETLVLPVVDTAPSKAYSAGDSYGRDGTRTRDLRREQSVGSRATVSRRNRVGFRNCVGVSGFSWPSVRFGWIVCRRLRRLGLSRLALRAWRLIGST